MIFWMMEGGFEHEHHKYVDAKKKDMYSSNVVFSGQYVDHLGLLAISILWQFLCNMFAPRIGFGQDHTVFNDHTKTKTCQQQLQQEGQHRLGSRPAALCGWFSNILELNKQKWSHAYPWKSGNHPRLKSQYWLWLRHYGKPQTHASVLRGIRGVTHRVEKTVWNLRKW